MQQKDQRIECMSKDIAFLQQSMQQERQKLQEQMLEVAERTRSQTREEVEREFEREMMLRLQQEVKRVEREKQDRADAKLLSENEKLRRSLCN